MHEPRARVSAHVAAEEDGDLSRGERMDAHATLELRPHDAPDRLERRTQRLRERFATRFGDNVPLAARRRRERVREVGADADGLVGGERPWRGGPGDEGRLRLVQQGECDDHRRVVHVLVVEIFLRSTAVDVDQTSAGAGEGQVRETAGARVAVRTSKLEIGVAQAMYDPKSDAVLVLHRHPAPVNGTCEQICGRWVSNSLL